MPLLEWPNPEIHLPDSFAVGAQARIEIVLPERPGLRYRDLDSAYPRGIELRVRHRVQSGVVDLVLPYREGAVEFTKCFELQQAEHLLVKCLAPQKILVGPPRDSLPLIRSGTLPTPDNGARNWPYAFLVLLLLPLLLWGPWFRLAWIGRGWSPWSLVSDLKFVEKYIASRRVDLLEDYWELRYGTRACGPGDLAQFVRAMSSKSRHGGNEP